MDVARRRRPGAAGRPRRLARCRRAPRSATCSRPTPRSSSTARRSCRSPPTRRRRPRRNLLEILPSDGRSRPSPQQLTGRDRRDATVTGATAAIARRDRTDGGDGPARGPRRERGPRPTGGDRGPATSPVRRARSRRRASRDRDRGERTVRRTAARRPGPRFTPRPSCRSGRSPSASSRARPPHRGARRAARGAAPDRRARPAGRHPRRAPGGPRAERPAEGRGQAGDPRRRPAVDGRAAAAQAARRRVARPRRCRRSTTSRSSTCATCAASSPPPTTRWSPATSPPVRSPRELKEALVDQAGQGAGALVRRHRGGHRRRSDRRAPCKLSSQPPKAGVRFPAELAGQLGGRDHGGAQPRRAARPLGRRARGGGVLPDPQPGHSPPTAHPGERRAARHGQAPRRRCCPRSPRCSTSRSTRRRTRPSRCGRPVASDGQEGRPAPDARRRPPAPAQAAETVEPARAGAGRARPRRQRPRREAGDSEPSTEAVAVDEQPHRAAADGRIAGRAGAHDAEQRAEHAADTEQRYDDEHSGRRRAADREAAETERRPSRQCRRAGRGRTVLLEP